MLSHEEGNGCDRRRASGGALGAALVFVTGCLGTKVLLFLGISSGALSGLTALEPYRPLLLVLGGAVFAVGLWRIVRRRKAAEPARA